MELIKILEAQRIKQDVTQRELAKQADFTQSYYALIVKGERKGITLAAFEAMASYLKLDLRICLRE
jgi:transcriptional regulator with XRE-family HTH domain